MRESYHIHITLAVYCYSCSILLLVIIVLLLCLIYKLNFIIMKWVKVAQSCLTLCDPVDYSLPGSSVHEILQARILEWVAYVGNLPDPGVKLGSPVLQVDSLSADLPGKPQFYHVYICRGRNVVYIGFSTIWGFRHLLEGLWKYPLWIRETTFIICNCFGASMSQLSSCNRLYDQGA